MVDVESPRALVEQSTRLETAHAPPEPSRNRARVDGRFLVGGAIILTVVVASLIAPLLTPWDPIDNDLVGRLKPPGTMVGTSLHILGTDELGRDVLARVLFGGRISLLVGAVSVLVTGTLGTLLGMASAYLGGWIDHVVMRLADIQLAFPFLLLAIVIMAVLRPSLLNVILVLTVTGWVGFARLARAQCLAVGGREYLTSARAVGCSTPRIMLRYLLPNIATPLAVFVAYQVPQFILAEASLSFLGLGVAPPTPSWGSSISTGHDYLPIAWWVSTFPGIALALTVVGVGLLGDALRDRLDPVVGRRRA
jgi:peptide/nickel transport system permease protein